MMVLTFIGLCVVTTLACAVIGLVAWWAEDAPRRRNRLPRATARRKGS